jgi:hypothetical protein
MIGHEALNGQMRSKSHAALVLHHTRIDRCAMKKFGNNGKLWNKLFLIVIHRFSLVKVAMMAPRICKMRNGVNKTPQFCNCQLRRGGMEKKDLIQVRNEYPPQPSKLLYNSQFKNMEAL